MIKYFVSFVFYTAGTAGASTAVVTAAEDATHADILAALHASHWPEAEYVRKFEPWD